MNYPITKTERYAITRSPMELIASPLQDCLETIVIKAFHQNAQIIMISAAHRAAGVTTLCANLATYLSENHGTTLLADGEALIKLAERGIPPRRSFYREIKAGYIWVLGATEIAEVSETVEGASVSSDAVMAALKEQFDYVVIDTPAMSQSTSAETLAGGVDASIFVAVPCTTERQEASAAAKRLTAAGGRILGSIYNTAYQNFGTGA